MTATNSTGDDAVDHLGVLHVCDSRSVEREHQHIAARRDGAAAEHDDPVDHLLAGVEAVGGRMIMPDHAAAALEPLDIDRVGNVAADHIRKDQHDAEREREAQIVVGVLRPFRPRGEGLGPDQRQQQRLAERDVEPGERRA